jgi:hypothetical protein
MPVRKPSENYLSMIATGVMKTHELSRNALIDYFLSKRGIIGNYSREDLFELVNTLT